MKLEEAIKIIKDIDVLDDVELQEAYNTVLQELEHLQKENEELKEELHKKKIIAPGRRNKKNTYEFGLIVGTKRERDWWQNKIREKIKEINDKRLEVNGWESEFDYAVDVLQDLLKEE